MGNNEVQTPNLEGLQSHENESIQRTANEIAEINDTSKTNEQQKVQLEWILTTDFANTLNNNPEIAKTLYNELPDQTKWEDEAITELRNFLEPIAKPHKIEWDISDVTNNNEQKKAAPIINNFSDYFWEGKTLSNIPEWINNSITTAIENIQTILNNPTKENIQKLQNFLYNNLTGSEKDTFKNSNRKSNNRDWSFWDSTENALKNFLKNTADYVQKYNKHQEIAEKWDKQKEQEIQDATNAVNWLTNPTQESYDAVKEKYDEAKAKYDEAKAKYWDNFDSNWELETKLNEIEWKLKINETREKASKSTISFNTLSQKLNTFNDSEINWILAQQIKPLNEKLKQWPSINELNAKISELEWKIKSYDKDWLWLDNKDKKWNRKAINDLQNELKQIKKELDNKRDIKKDLSTQLSRIKGIINSDNNEKNIKDFYGLQNNENTNIIKKENKQEQEQDRTPFSQYERSLDDIWNGKEPSETTQWENTPEQTNQTQTPEQAQKAVNKPRSVNTGLSALFDKVGFKRDENVWFWKNIWNALWAVFGSYFWFSMKWKESIVGIIKPDQINLENFEPDSKIRTALEAINNETKAFNWRKEIVNAINGKEEQQIKNLQRKLRTFPESDKESNIKITWTIDETTADALKTYATEQAKQNEQNNWTEMPYAFCKWYTKIDTKIPNAEIYQKENDYILIETNNCNITSITKWEVENKQTIDKDPTEVPKFKTESTKVYALWTEQDKQTTIEESKYSAENGQKTKQNATQNTGGQTAQQ